MNQNYTILYKFRSAFSRYSDGYDLIWSTRNESCMCIPFKIPLSLYTEEELISRVLHIFSSQNDLTIDSNVEGLHLYDQNHEIVGNIELTPYHSYYLMTVTLPKSDHLTSPDYNNVR